MENLQDKLYDTKIAINSVAEICLYKDAIELSFLKIVF